MYSHLTPAVAGSRLADDVAAAEHSVLAAEALEGSARRRFGRVRFFGGGTRAAQSADPRGGRTVERPAARGASRPARA